MKPQQDLNPEDVVELGIDQLGESRQNVVAWQPAAFEPSLSGAGFIKQGRRGSALE
jgi:hypothetical protein